MISIRLPWPSRDLSPNARGNWRIKWKATKEARERARLMTLEEIGGRWIYLPEDILITVIFVPSKRRQHYDHDNAQASLKAYCDGLADALRVNDRRFRYVYRHQHWDAEDGIHFEIGD